MKKTFVVFFSLMLFVSAGSAAMFPSNISIDLNIDIFGDDKDKQQQQEKQNTTYGQRVGGQAVHRETGSNNPDFQRNSDNYGVTEEDTNENNDFAEMISAFIFDIMGKKGGPDTSEPNSVT